jgi:hypothetical protein
MRIIASLISIVALSQVAIAQTPDCKSIADAGERLTCYDKAAPVAKTPAQAAKPPASKVDASKYVDAISAEDARMNARLKSICRGC